MSCKIRKLAKKSLQKIRFAYVFMVILVILNIYISQGSVTAQLRCGGIFNNHLTTNFLQNMRVKKF